MTAHEQFGDDLALYALGTLEGDERVALERHLQECAGCRKELARLRGDAALLAMAAGASRPPARSRERLMAAVAREPRREAQPVVPIRRARATPWWGWMGWAAAAACLVFAVVLVHQNRVLQRRLFRVEARITGQDKQLQEAKELLSSLTAPDAEKYVLTAGNKPPQPQGRAIYVASSGTLVFIASHMPALPPQKAYELWLIPDTGTPIPAGVFKPDGQGSAAVVKPPLPVGITAKTFAITVEPEAGSDAPTSHPVMVGSAG
ncbi:MAG TPA: anti-sigma factor [Candidatus Sulfotelmatobacter sp.]|nr:anti-sigma factor [Candidatus Sulfotelmatobacter sp.]